VKLPGPFHITRVAETEGTRRDLNFLLPTATSAELSVTRTAKDARFVDVGTNTLIMANHSLIVRTQRHVILVDTCVGNDKHRPELADWHMRATPFLEELAKAGYAPEDITHVLCTHLHADHVGWNTRLLNGRWVPTFPNAKYLMHRTEFEHSERESHNTSTPLIGRVWADSIQPLVDAKQVLIVGCDYEIEPGVRLVPAFGHTPGSVMLALDDGTDKAYLVGDVMHHPVQIERPDWSSRFCWDADLSRATRTQFLSRVADTKAWVIPAHFSAPCAVQIVGEGSGFWYKANGAKWNNDETSGAV
jgi:glyoxylase-like metal-dependent hydrolase (beta-lactamase superfamily II)